MFQWRTSTYSQSGGNPQCVEVGAWRTSTYSQSSGEPQCVEVGVAPGRVGVRDSKAPQRGHLDVSRTAFRGLVALAKAHG